MFWGPQIYVVRNSPSPRAKLYTPYMYVCNLCIYIYMHIIFIYYIYTRILYVYIVWLLFYYVLCSIILGPVILALLTHTHTPCVYGTYMLLKYISLHISNICVSIDRQLNISNLGIYKYIYVDIAQYMYKNTSTAAA